MTYAEKSTQLALDASVAVLVLMGAPNDVEFVPIKPRAADEAWRAELKARWPGRGLRSVGVIGLCGTSARCALREPIGSDAVEALATAFFEYIRVLLGDDFAAHMAAAEIEELERHYALEDPRPYPHPDLEA